MIHTDLKYVGLLSCHFERVVRKNGYLWNVRCPICLDSQIKKNKMRGYIYQSEQRLAYKCHNCNASMWFGALIKHLNPRLYKEYLMETFKESDPGARHRRQVKLLTTPGFFDQPLESGTSSPKTFKTAEFISKLPQTHFAVQYVNARKIPTKTWSRLLFTERYRDFCDEVYPKHGKKLSNDGRLVIPFYDAHGSLIAVSGRAFNDTGVRYITIRTNADDSKLIYGLDRVDQSKTVLVVEGPLDSLFLENTIASGDANLISVTKHLSAAKVTLVFDNESRNKEIVKQMEEAIQLRCEVVVWPEWLLPKDINEMVLAGYPAAAIADIIHKNTYNGLTALTHLNFWKRCSQFKGVTS
jgi:hypothetical protein